MGYQWGCDVVELTVWRRWSWEHIKADWRRALAKKAARKRVKDLEWVNYRPVTGGDYSIGGRRLS